MADVCVTYPLHECVFQNDVRQLSSLLRISEINQKDPHGNFSFNLMMKLFLKFSECLWVLVGNVPYLRLVPPLININRL